MTSDSYQHTPESIAAAVGRIAAHLGDADWGLTYVGTGPDGVSRWVAPS